MPRERDRHAWSTRRWRWCRLPDHGERLPKQLSGGQQQRVALARAMVYRPALLLMDEPLGALDRKLREQLQLEIKRVHRERGISVLYVTHDQEEALTMSDRIAVFNKGRIEQIGTPEELYDRPATRFVASFIGDTNLVEGRVLGVAGGICEIETAAGRVAASARTPLEAGAAVFVAVRPERVVLAPVADGRRGPRGRHCRAGLPRHEPEVRRPAGRRHRDRRAAPDQRSAVRAGRADGPPIVGTRQGHGVQRLTPAWRRLPQAKAKPMVRP